VSDSWKPYCIARVADERVEWKFDNQVTQVARNVHAYKQGEQRKELPMRITIAIEHVANNGYRARCGEPLLLVAEGATSDEAAARLRAMISEKLAAGVELRDVAIGAPNPALVEEAGRWDPNDPIYAEWRKELEKYRAERNAELELELESR
jgi:hypothetical protein